MIVRVDALVGLTDVSGPATVSEHADRIITGGHGLLFPVHPFPVCNVFNNFGGFSKTFGAGGHQGVDIGVGFRQEVFAVEAGVLYRQFSGGTSGFGWGLTSVSDVRYRYYHLDGFAEGLVVGDRVDRGDLIGYVGDTGNASPGGWHLHFEVRPGPTPYSKPVDPVQLLDIPTVCTVF
jgi:murein DD-endopeptidase MepM/ murein hydrolase activator NlpD